MRSRSKAQPVTTKKMLSTLQKNYRSVLVVLGFFVLWELIVRIAHVPEFVLPSPSSALGHLFIEQPDANYNWSVHISTTIYEFLLGFIVTAVLGVSLAILFVWNRHVKKIVMPLFTFVNSLPIIAIAPIILLWMGYGIRTNILIAFLVSFFPVVINTMAGLDAIEDDLLDLIRYLHASKFQIFVKIRIPNSLSYIFSGLKICSTMSIVGAIVGEFIASDRGLGYIIINSQYAMDTPPIFSSLIVISLAGVALYWLITLIERIAMPWAFKNQRN
ncbi:MAG: ABC transporter permease [Sphaerochaetaceae bacterium]|nr:ABC transporter permease [Sphaerochaetaceae bacterium]